MQSVPYIAFFFLENSVRRGEKRADKEKASGDYPIGTIAPQVGLSPVINICIPQLPRFALPPSKFWLCI